MLKIKLASVMISVVMLLASPAFAVDQWIEKTSSHDVNKTTDRLVAAIKGAGATLFTVIDHQAGAEKAGLKMNAAKVVIFGNPKLGTPIMNANPKAALDLPIKVLIWENNGEVKLGALTPDAFSSRYDLEGVEPQLKTMNGALNKLMSKAAE